MHTRLVLAAAVFHFVNLAALAWTLRTWRHRYFVDPVIRPRPLVVTLHIGLLGAVAGGAAVAIGLAARMGGFGVINLATQWLFAEVPLGLALSAGFLFGRGRRGMATGSAVCLLALVAVFVDAYVVEPNAIDVHEHEIPPAVGRARPGAATSASRALRITHLSDIQTPAIGEHERRAFREAIATQPDLIVLSGDYIHALPGQEDEETAREQLRDLLNSLTWPPLGIYAVKGDTEGTAWPAMFEGTRVVTLTDAAARVPLPDQPTRFLSLLGLSPAVARGSERNKVRRLVRAIPRDDLIVVLGHSPDFVMDLEAGSVDLAVGGHTHGGQIALPFFGPPLTLSRLPRRMARGLHDWKGTPLHVSAGVGMERHFAPQIRFLCRPEICLLRAPL